MTIINHSKPLHTAKRKNLIYQNKKKHECNETQNTKNMLKHYKLKTRLLYLKTLTTEKLIHNPKPRKQYIKL